MKSQLCRRPDVNRTVFWCVLLTFVFFFAAGQYFADVLQENSSVIAAEEFPGIDDDVEPPAPVAPPTVGNANNAANAPAQNTEGAAEPPVRKNYLVWMIGSLGWFFAPVFLALSIIMVALFVINLLAIRREVLRPSLLVEEFSTLLEQKKYQNAYEVAKENDSLLGKVLAAGLAKMSSGYEQAVQAMQDVGEEETMRLESRLKYLALIGNIAPMLGLFGTVTGMIASFQEIAVSISPPPAFKLAEGISTALFTTEVGLAIAIPSIAFYDIMRGHLSRCILEISITSDNLMSRFKK